MIFSKIFPKLDIQLDLPTLCLFLSFCFQTASLALGKKASLSIQSFSITAVVSNEFYLGSIFALGMQAIVWQVALSKFSLSVAYSFMSLTFVSILLISHFIFGESIDLKQILGVVAISIGVVLLFTRSDTVAPGND